MKPARLIQYPPPSNLFGKGVVCFCVILLSIVPFSIHIFAWSVVTSLLLVVIAALARDVQALHLSLFTAPFIVAPYLHPTLRSWPYALLVPLLCYGTVVLAVPKLRRSLLWLRPGNVDREMVLAAAAVSMISGLALLIWYYALKPDVAVQLRNMPGMPVWLFPFAGMAFAVSNAAMEEFVFRGVVMQSLDSAFEPGSLSVLVQAWLFGAMHFLQGFPKGGWGLAMAVVYGILLGWIRRRSRGMLAPWAAHVCADLVIFAVLSGIVLNW
jgi:membrane protease YdiL (CAAX protease family)